MRGRYTNQKRPIEHFGPMLCSCVFSYSYSKRSSIAIRPIGPQVPANRFDRRAASQQFKQPSSTSTVSLSTVRRGGLSTSTTKKSFNPQPTARESLLFTHIVLSIATIRTNWDLISINVESFVVEKGVCLCCLDSITITSTVRCGGLSTSTTKHDATYEQSFSPQPTARKWLFSTHIVLSIATTRMKELGSIDTANASSFLHRRGPAA